MENSTTRKEAIRFMTEIKIISNPFEKSTHFEVRENKGTPWTAMNSEGSLGSLISEKIEHGYFLQNLEEVCEAIEAYSHEGEEGINLYFEGPKNEYESLRKYLEHHVEKAGDTGDKETVVLEPLTRELISGNELLNLVCNQLVNFSREAQEEIARGNYDSELNAMTAALDEQLNIGKNASSIEEATWQSYPYTVKARDAMLGMLKRLIADIDVTKEKILSRRNAYSNEHSEQTDAFNALRDQIKEKIMTAADAVKKEDLAEYVKYMDDHFDFDHDHYSVESLTKVFEGFIDLAKMEQELKERQKFMEQFKWEAPKNDNTYEIRQAKFKQLDREFQQKVQEAYKKANEIAYPYGIDYDYDALNTSGEHDDDGNPGVVMTLEERTELFEKVFREYTDDLLRESERKYEEIMDPAKKTESESELESDYEPEMAEESMDIDNSAAEADSVLTEEEKAECEKDELVRSAVCSLEKSINEELPESTQRTMTALTNTSDLFWYTHAQTASDRIFDQICDLDKSDANLADDLRLYVLQYLRKTPFANKEAKPSRPENMKIAICLESTDDEKIKGMLQALSADIDQETNRVLNEYGRILRTRHAGEYDAWIDAFVKSAVRYLDLISPELEDRENDIEEADQKLRKCERALQQIQTVLDHFEKALAWKSL